MADDDELDVAHFGVLEEHLTHVGEHGLLRVGRGVRVVEAYGDRVALTARVDDPATEQLLQINFGPWDRLRGNEPFLPGVGAKPLGANFYPADATRAEIEAGPDELPVSSNQPRL